MADNSSGGVGILGVLVGAAIVVGIGFFLFQSGMVGGKPAGPSITITAPGGK
jgi:hypothetical protein